MKRCSDTELQAMVTRYERAVFAGTSSHRDVVKLIAAEREILRREAKRVKQTVREERSARTASSSGGWLSVDTVPRDRAHQDRAHQDRAGDDRVHDGRSREPS